MDTLTPTTNGVKDRLNALLEAVLSKAKINPIFAPTIKTLARNFLADVSEADLIEGINELKTKYIPWILGEEAFHENTSGQ